MAWSTLTTWPLVLFGVIEPILLVWAFAISILDPFHFYSTQVPHAAIRPSDFQPQGLVLTLQMGNVFLLLAALAVVCCWTPRAATTKWYLVAVAFADYGHIYGTYAGMGDAFWDVAGWNDVVWGGVGISAFLNVFRWLTVLGVFGGLREEKEGASLESKKHA